MRGFNVNTTYFEKKKSNWNDKSMSFSISKNTIKKRQELTENIIPMVKKVIIIYSLYMDINLIPFCLTRSSPVSQ